MNPTIEKVYYIPTDEKIMCLTFDDGPSNPTTSIILDILKNFNIKATFFVLLENVIHNVPIVKRILLEGHEIGLHGHEHVSLTKYPKIYVYRYVKQCINAIQQQFGITVKYFRPPYGTLPVDAAKIITGDFNLIPVGWSATEKDWKTHYTSLKSKSLLKKSSPGKIILMHDCFRHWNWPHNGTTIGNLKQILPRLINKGYSFTTIQDLINSKNQTPRKSYNDIPLLHHEIINFADKSVLYLYWDVNAIKDSNKCICPTCCSSLHGIMFEFKINNINTPSFVAKYPSPTAMKEWIQQIEFPLRTINENTEIFIQNNVSTRKRVLIKTFVKI